jgi:hypothetical protein
MPTTITLQPTGQLLTVPTKWADVSLAQFVAIIAPEPGDTRTEAEVLCGLEAGSFDQLLVEQAQIIAPLLAFAADASDVLERLPTPGLPDVGSLPYGTLRVAQDYIEAHEGRPWLAYGARLLALYRMTMLWGSAGGAKVAACEAALLASPVTEVYPDAAFFLSQYKAYTSGTPPTPKTKTSPATKKSTPAASTWQTGSARCLAWMRRLRAPS